MTTREQWQPQLFEIAQCEKLAGIGLNEDQIADYLDISRSTLQVGMKKHDELRKAILRGRAKALASVAGVAYQMAASGNNTRMTEFYLKCRGGWKFTTVVEHEGLKESEEAKVKALVEEFKELLSGKTEKDESVSPGHQIGAGDSDSAGDEESNPAGVLDGITPRDGGGGVV